MATMTKVAVAGATASLSLLADDRQERGHRQKDKRQQQRPSPLKAKPGQDRRGKGRYAVSCPIFATCRRTEGIESRKKLPAGPSDLPAMVPAWRGRDRRDKRKTHIRRRPPGKHPHAFGKIIDWLITSEERINIQKT